MVNQEEMIEDYKKLGSYQKVAQKYQKEGRSLSRQRIHQLIGNKVEPVDNSPADKDIVERFKDNYGHYTKTAEDLRTNYNRVKRVVVDNFSEEEVRELRKNLLKGSSYPNEKLFQPYKHQMEILDSLDERVASQFIREGLGRLFSNSDTEQIVSDYIFDSKESKGVLAGKFIHIRLDDEQGEALDKLSDKLGRGSISAVLRAAVDVASEQRDNRHAATGDN